MEKHIKWYEYCIIKKQTQSKQINSSQLPQQMLLRHIERGAEIKVAVVTRLTGSKRSFCSND